MTRLLLVRHAETLAHGPKILQGDSSHPNPLSARGHAQAAACGAALRALALPEPRVYSSAALRAQQTAQHLAHALSAPLRLLPGLHEINPGHWEGRPQETLYTHGHQLFTPDGTFAFPGGEKLTQVAARTRQAVREARAGGGTPVLVSHGLALQVLLCDLLTLPFQAAWHDQRFHHANTAVTELRWEAGRWALVRTADHAHLSVGR